MKSIQITNTTKWTIAIIFPMIIFSCKSKKLNYIDYYHKVYAIDSTFRLKKDTLSTIKQYKKLFRKYTPSQNERLEEYENYIKYADQHHKKFGGEKSLDKLIAQVAPYWKYKREDKEFFRLYQRYGIDSLEVERKVVQWKKGLHKILIDSFSVAFVRDQANKRMGPDVEMNDRKNEELLLWTIKNYGFPSKQKIGLLGNQDIFMPMGVLLNHMSESKHYEYFKTTLLEYVKSGECPPRDYIQMVDKYQYVRNLPTEYGTLLRYESADLSSADSARIDKNRRAIGFPVLKYSFKITKDFQNKLKE